MKCGKASWWWGCWVFLALALLASPTPAQCQSNSDCKTGRVCLRGVCSTAVCTKDSDCSGDNICEGTTCQAPAGVSGRTDPQRPVPPPALRSKVDGPPQTESITWLWATGTVAASVTYLMTIGLGAALSQDSVRGQAIGYLMIPVLGPFVLNASDIRNPQYAGPLIASGVVQLASVTMIVAGLVMQRPVASISYSFGVGADPPKLFVEPTNGGSGLQARLTF